MKNISAKIIFGLLSLVVMLAVISLSVCAETSQETATNDTPVVTTEVVTTEEITVVETVASEPVDTAPSETQAAGEETDASTSQEEGALNVDFTPSNFVANLKYMAAGMAGIFIVIGAIVLCIVILGKVTDRKSNDEE